MTSSRVQIIATIGPVSGAQEILERLVDVGMDVMRLNFSHGTHDEHASYIANLRRAARQNGKRVPIILDISGPRVQTRQGHAFDAKKEKITEKDLRDLDFGIAHGIDYIAQSYVGDADDVVAMRSEIERRGARIPIIAKIERREAVEKADEIIAAADAVMIGRGDLGEEMPVERIPFIEKELIEKCNRAGKSVITATQMMFSMIEKPTPTRAEVTDVTYAVVCGSDAIMLSEETALGQYPVEAVAAMEKIAREAERHMPSRKQRLL